MTNTIRNADKDFDFNKLHLGNPHSLQGGSYFSKLANRLLIRIN